MRQIATADVGGTHARFALATIDGGQVVELGEPVTLKTAEHGSFQLAWQEFGRRSGGELPNELVDRLRGAGRRRDAQAHQQSVGDPPGADQGPARRRPLHDRQRLRCGRSCGCALARRRLPAFVRSRSAAARARRNRHRARSRYRPRRCDRFTSRAGHYEVIETEGGHVDFAPLDSLEDQILQQLRKNFRRVSVERLVAGRGLWNIYEALGAIEGLRADLPRRQGAVGGRAASYRDSLANAALDRFCLSLGAVSGDMALAQGASAVVIAGGLGLRLARPSAALRISRPLHRQGPVRAADGRNAGQAHHSPAARPLRRGGGLRAGASMTIDEIMRTAPVIPVLVLDGEADPVGARRDAGWRRAAGARSHASHARCARCHSAP